MTAPLALKTFWDRLEVLLLESSPDHLRDVLRGLAGEIGPDDRQVFLDRFRPARKVSPSLDTVIQEDKLLEDVEKEIEALEDAISAGGEDDWDEYDDEDSLGPYEEFVEPLSGLLERIDAAFDEGRFSLARQAYEVFLRIEDMADDYGRHVELTNLKPGTSAIEESLVRYLRAVYESAPLSERVTTIFAIFEMLLGEFYRFVPGLEALEAIYPKPLPDREEFLSAWIRFLEPQDTPIAEQWFREAVRLHKGMEGLASLARTGGAKHPRAWLDWGEGLLEGEDFAGAIAVGREALSTFAPLRPIRAAIAEQMARAADAIGDQQTLRLARWEAYEAKPSFDRLLDLWDATAPGEQASTMARCAEHALEYRQRNPPRPYTPAPFYVDDLEAPASIPDTLIAQAWLLADRWEAAKALVAGAPALGWSYSEDGQRQVVAYTLVRLSGKEPGSLPHGIGQLWRPERGYQQSWSSSGPAVDPQTVRRDRVFGEHMRATVFVPARQAEGLAWCLEVARKRIDAIVGGTHRSSYDQAALLAAACGEALKGLGRTGEATGFLAEIRGQYPRHTAFQRELQSAMSVSGFSQAGRRR